MPDLETLQVTALGIVVIAWMVYISWFWSPGKVRIVTTELERDREDWRALALALLHKQWIAVVDPDQLPEKPVLDRPGVYVR